MTKAKQKTLIFLQQFWKIPGDCNESELKGDRNDFSKLQNEAKLVENGQ